MTSLKVLGEGLQLPGCKEEDKWRHNDHRWATYLTVQYCVGRQREGAIYGAIFLDFARRMGLREAVGRYLNSSDDNVLTFEDFRNLIIAETDFDDDITQVANTWGL